MINTHPAFYAILSESDAYNVNVKGPTQGHEFEVKNDKDSYDFFDKLYNTDLCYKSKQVTIQNWTGWAWVDINVIYQYIKEKQAERDNYIVAKVITKLIQIHEIKSYIKE